MTDSLRDQLLQAGFKEKTPRAKTHKANTNKAGKKGSPHKKAGQSTSGKPTKPGHRGGQSSTSHSAGSHQPGKRSKAAEEAAEVAAHEAQKQAEKKATKEKIRALIEEHRIKDHAGDVAYSYQVGSRVRQLFVKQEYQNKLSAGELVITRLNGNTLLIPPEAADQVLALNSDWAIIRIEDQSSETDPEYADYQIPDDLTW